MTPRDPALQAFLSSLAVGAFCAVLSLLAPLRASGGDTVPGRYGAAVFACKSSLDLRQVDWIEADDARDSLPYYAARASDGAVVSVFGPLPALMGAPFMESLETGSVFLDLELERRARHASALALALAATLLCAALCARASPPVAAALALVTSLSFAGVPTLGQGLWQQTALMVPLMAAVATLAWASWRGGALLALSPGFLAVAAFARPNAAILVLALGVTWVLAVVKKPRRVSLVSLALPLAVLMTLPQLAWNASRTGDPLALHAYVAAHSDGPVVFGLGLRWFFTGLLGLVLSPARGLLFFAPVLLVSLYAGIRHGDMSSRAIAAGILLHVALVAAYRQWWGGWVFGPRMLAETVWLAPLLVVSLRPQGKLRAALVATGALTVAVGLLGTFRYEIGAWDLGRDPDRHHEALWDPVDSPISAMIRGTRTSTIDAPKGPYGYCLGQAIRSVHRVQRDPATP
jgi:hypothetical protein